eukprot:Gb_26311 [translate_table: standard]
MAQHLWNQKKKNIFLLLGNGTFTSTLTKTKIRALKREQSPGNGDCNANNSTHEPFHDVKTLCHHRPFKEALNILYTVNHTGIRPDSSIYASLLQRCVKMKALPEGKLVHAHIIQTGFNPDTYLDTKIVILYAMCGSLLDARRGFDKMPERNVVSWNAMIAAYARHGCCEQALTLFYDMHQNGVQADEFTYASVLPACAKLAALEQGKEVHEDVIRTGFLSDIFVANALLDMYAKCGNTKDAFHVFDKMSERDVVSWSAMISGYADNGYFDEALKLFRQMQVTGMEPNSVTFACVLSTCANLAALHEGKEVHGDVIRSGFQYDIVVGNALVDMYAKCGSIEYARNVFDKMRRRVVVSWNAMIGGYAMHGCGKQALQLFEQMKYRGIKPDHVTFIGVLSACCHAGLLDDGWHYFHCMSRDYDITPSLAHYGCMVDLLGRTGCLEDAEDFINKMPIKPGVAVWRSLLGACRIHANIELGERVAGRLFESDPENAGHYVLLSNIYAAAGRWDDVEKVRKMMKEMGIEKVPGCSWIEVDNKVYTFFVGDRSYPQKQEICVMLERLSGQMKEAGYVPETNFVLHDVEEEQKEHILCHHSEKLATVFGIINTVPGTPIRIIKNLRMCGDCHSTTKFISKIVEREVFVRDANRFHHFKDGQCSCGDYW